MRAHLLRILAKLSRSFDGTPALEVLAELGTPNVRFRGRPITPEEAHDELARYFAPEEEAS